jgi:NitT/TauT family transport system ATP-binding protein
MRAGFLERHPDTVAALVRAVGAAADWAGEAANRTELARLLAQPRYVGAPAALLLAALHGELALEPGGAPLRREGFFILNRDATRPRSEDAAMLLDRMQRCGQLPGGSAVRPAAAGSFRVDVHAAAMAGALSDVRAGQG